MGRCEEMMKRYEQFITTVWICWVPFVLVVCIAGCIWDQSNQEQARAQPAEPKVWVMPSGKRYHVYECEYVTYTARPFTIAEAVERGRTPCRVCKPEERKEPETIVSTRPISPEDAEEWRKADIIINAPEDPFDVEPGNHPAAHYWKSRYNNLVSGVRMGAYNRENPPDYE